MDLYELNVSTLLQELRDNWEKPKELIEISDSYEQKPVEITLYESAIVLISANLESGSKRLIKYWLSDYNFYLGAAKANKKILQTLTSSYYADDKGNGFNKNRIQEIYINHSIPIDENCFISLLKNPKRETFKNFFSKVGDIYFFEKISNGIFKDIFSPNSDEREQIFSEVLRRLELLKNSPVSTSIELISKLDKKDMSNKDDSWGVFLQQLMIARNKVAHGNDEQITLTEKSVSDFLEKAEIFQYLVVLNLYQILFDDLNKVTEE